MTKFWRNYKRLRAYERNKSFEEHLRIDKLKFDLKNQKETIEMLKARIAELVELNYRLSERR